MWMRVMDMWRSKCGGRGRICPNLAQWLYALVSLSLSLQKVSSLLCVFLLSPYILNLYIIVVASDPSSPSLSLFFLQPGLITWALVATWTLLQVSACRRSGLPFWMTWDILNWRGQRPLALSYVCQYMVSWENLPKLQSLSMTLSLTVSDLIFF